MRDAERELRHEELSLLAGADEALRYSYRRCLAVGDRVRAYRRRYDDA